MGRNAWLLLAWLPLWACNGVTDEMLSAPAAVSVDSATSTTASSPEAADSTGDVAHRDTADATTGTTDPGPSRRDDEGDPFAEALSACADDALGPAAFERAYEARMCEEWMACADSDCIEGSGGQLGSYSVESFDPEAACTCLEVAWACETSYGASSEIRVVVPDVSCFEVY